MDEPTALRVACGFGGGCARLGLTCGAVTGAYMVIGLKYGKVKADDNDAKEKTYAFVQEFSERFVERNKSLNCKELMGCDLGTPEGRVKVKEQNLVATICEKVVRDAAEILEKIS
jgi:C_GCAxxG_C_C family probable redox protein